MQRTAQTVAMMMACGAPKGIGKLKIGAISQALARDEVVRAKAGQAKG